MAGRLEGKVAIVTGAGSSGPGTGTGKAISILFAREGASVALVDRDVKHAQETLDQVSDEGGNAFIVEADVTESADCTRIVDETCSRSGRLDILVNNVGILGGGGVVDETEDAWARVIDVNLTSVMRMSKCSIPRMAETGGGAIVNITSIAGLRGAGTASYAASKAGMIGLMRDIAVVYGPQGIRTNCIAPGHIHTPMVDQGRGGDREMRRRISPLGTEGDAWDIAWAAVFLASDEARWITGVTLPVEAGILAAIPLVLVPNVMD